MDSSNSPTSKPLFRGVQMVWYILAVLEVFLAFRFMMKLLAANPEAGFSKFIYGATYIFATPFLAVFPNSTAKSSVFEWTTLLAMVVFWLIALAIRRLLVIGKSVSTSEAGAKLENMEKETPA